MYEARSTEPATAAVITLCRPAIISQHGENRGQTARRRYQVIQTRHWRCFYEDFRRSLGLVIAGSWQVKYEFGRRDTPLMLTTDGAEASLGWRAQLL